mmetsp:Transcript_126092/g.364882  ORF Transcript_126092/g.364882 Transcript_126092/m.364882 type:complete len:720 (-) Transcript_126092:54-2213(-)
MGTVCSRLRWRSGETVAIEGLQRQPQQQPLLVPIERRRVPTGSADNGAAERSVSMAEALFGQDRAEAPCEADSPPRRRRRRRRSRSGVAEDGEGDAMSPETADGSELPADRDAQLEVHLDDFRRSIHDVSKLELPPAALLLLGDMRRLLDEFWQLANEAPNSRKASLESLRGPELSPREHLEWNAACPGGGTLLKMFICMASEPSEVESWITGRLSISDLGLAFDSGCFTQAEVLCTSLIWWSDVVDLEIHILHVGGAEVVMSFHEDADVNSPRLRLHMGTVGDAEWLREVWRVCKALQPRRSRRMPTTVGRHSLEEAAASAMAAMEGTSSGSDCEPTASAAPATAVPSDALKEVWQELLNKCQVATGMGSKALSICSSMVEWREFDIFELWTITEQPLAAVGLSVLASLGLLEELAHSASSVYKVISAWERGYKKNLAFHNSAHAADVAQSVFHTLATAGLSQWIPPYLSIAMLTASMMHDVGHPGVDNRFLVASGDALAIRYNDRSPLENMHAATGFEILRATGIDLFGNIDQTRNVRKHIVSMVLATDMAVHHAGLLELEDVTKRGVSWDDAEMQDIITKVLVHISDIGNPTRPYHIFQQWTDRVMDEFFKQADLERDMNLCFAGSLSRGHLPLDRRKPFNVPLFQLSFTKNVVLNSYEVVSRIPDLDFAERMETLHGNIQRLQQDSEAYAEEQRKLVVAEAAGEEREAGETSAGS